ncbi:hypothetical protein P3X46_019058 [Hevea brasiliensis]|uniref:H/ACA ribonucleoprotein complex non-core subunit NAF1 n=1 Tax=Hevea brasiliensis TaxID=3981 RepID=A0ABQ9LTV1_HEVBR|nr:H/ACA ribonucleoprotein complex non-core subunit NAF1-like [Hevea brasiliensis]KAJ9171003.1 hypothetical protein P3X46_019058 [Hevea brasiliensis]
MVGCIPEPTIVEDDHNSRASKSKNLKDPLENAKLADFSFTDSFIDFDSIKEFFEDSPDTDIVSLGKIDFGKMGDNGFSSETHSNPSFEELRPIESGSGCVVIVNEERVGLVREGNFVSCIEEEMGRVSLVGLSSPICGDGKTAGDEIEMGNVSLVAGSNSVVPNGSVANSAVASDEVDIGNVYLATGSSTDAGTGSHVNNVVKSDKDDSGSDSDSSSESGSSSGSSSSSDEDEEDEEENEDEDEEEEGEKSDDDEEEDEEEKLGVEEGEIEEGEIKDVNGKEMVGKNDDYEEEEEDGGKMVEWSDVEFDDIDEEEEGDTVVLRRPIRSKNELKVLPPVPPLDVTLQPHHQMLPVGTVLSIMSAQVIVEGVKHNPLNEGTILWITENRSPLGIVDEIFGPVQHPFYVVRYNSESEVPAGICQGTLISFVSEFASHVLSDKNLYKKGYDASGENDEELSDDGEFSDDEKEAEYRRMQRMSKRGLNNQTVGNKKNNRKKVNNRNGNWKNNTPSGQQALVGVGQSPPNQNQHNKSSIGASMNNISSSTKGQDFRSGSGFCPPFSPMATPSGVFRPSDGVWVNGLPSQQSQNAVIPVGFPANNVSWPAQNQQLHPCQMPFLQQFNPSQGSLPSGVVPGGQMNIYAGPSPWPGVIGENCFNGAAFGMGFQVQPAHPTMSTMNVEGQGMMSGGLHIEPPGVIPENVQRFNLGASPSRGRKPYRHRGRGRFAGGRGWQSSK